MLSRSYERHVIFGRSIRYMQALSEDFIFRLLRKGGVLDAYDDDFFSEEEEKEEEG